MNISRMNTEVENITNQPNMVIGKALDLKKAFDKSGKDIKDFLNNILIPEIEILFLQKVDKETGKLSELINDGDGQSPYATYQELMEEIAKLVDSSPEALNTLNELARALGNDANFASTVLNLLDKKVDKEEGKVLSTNDYTNYEKEKLNSVYNFVISLQKGIIDQQEEILGGNL